MIQQNYSPIALPSGFAIPGAGPADPTVGAGPIAIAPSINATLSVPAASDVIKANGTSIGVARFFNSTTGAHFFTGSALELAAVQATHPTLEPEPLAFGAVDPATAVADLATISVYRFFDFKNGTEFLTASSAERDNLVLTSNDYTYEGVGFYEHASTQPNDTAVYRFFDIANGTHFFTANAGEVAAITASRPDMKAEGIAFYAPKLS